MPQCYNPHVLRGSDSTAFGRNSRFVAISNLTDSSRKRLEAIQKTDKKMIDFHMSIVARNIESLENNLDRIQNRLKENLKRTMAYKAVVDQKRFTKIVDKQRALNQDYTLRAMKGDIRDTLHKMDPSYIREQQARIKISHARRLQDSLINRNLRRVHTSRTRRRRDMRRDVLNKLKQQGMDHANMADELREKFPDAAWSLTPSPEPVVADDPENLSPSLRQGPGLITKPNYNDKGRTEQGNQEPGQVPPVGHPEETSPERKPEKKNTKKTKARKALAAKLAPLKGPHLESTTKEETVANIVGKPGKPVLPAINKATTAGSGPRRDEAMPGMNTNRMKLNKSGMMASIEVVEEANHRLKVDAATDLVAVT